MSLFKISKEQLIRFECTVYRTSLKGSDRSNRAEVFR